MINFHSSSRAAWLGLLVFFVGCGSGGHTNFNNVAVTVTPTSTTIASGGQVSLTAAVTGLPSGEAPDVTWTITELQTNGASGAQCNWSGSTPPAGPCPDGTIEGADTLTVTYHAADAGTFHVTAQWSTIFNPVITKSATSAITITP